MYEYVSIHVHMHVLCALVYYIVFKLMYEQTVYQNLVMFEAFSRPQSCLWSAVYFLRCSYSSLYIDTLKLHEGYSNTNLLLIWLFFVVLIYKPFMSILQLFRHSIDSDNLSSSVFEHHSCPEFTIRPLYQKYLLELICLCCIAFTRVRICILVNKCNVFSLESMKLI